MHTFKEPAGGLWGILNEDNAKQRHRDMRMMMIMKQIQSSERLVEIKLKTSERMNLGGSDEAQVFLSINLLMEKLERLKVFICFCPTSKYFAETLAMGGQADRTVEEKKKGSRKAQRKVTTDRNNVDREVGFDRGLTMQSKMQCAMMAQN